MNKELDELVSYIKNTSSYKNVISIKEKMDSNEEISQLVKKIKILQKKYVKSNYLDSDIKKELDTLESRLNEIPIYVEYMNNLEEVNNMIELVKDELNNYFNDLLNEK
ncbi:MAG: YlbF family regulator [Firmicutes bacterium]|nr:YlbF family regulator [Bacillota bacterium]